MFEGLCINEQKIINQPDSQKLIRIKMLRVQPSPHHLRIFLSSFSKQNDHFIIGENQIKTVEQIIDQILLSTFQKSQSFLITLLRKLILDILNRRLSLPLLEEILLLFKEYESEIKLYKQHIFQIEKLLFQQTIHDYYAETNQTSQLASNEDLNLIPDIDEDVNPILNIDEDLNTIPNIDSNDVLQNQLHKKRLVTWSILPHASQQIFGQEENNNQTSPSDYKNPKSLSIDIDCYSEDSKHNFIPYYDNKQFYSEYLTTSEDEKEFTSRSTVLQKIKQHMQSKLKIQPHVSDFNFGLLKNVPIDIEQELLEWKLSKHSILQQNSLQKALSPQDYDGSKFIEKMKQNHYRQKIKSVIIKRRLATKHLTT